MNKSFAFGPVKTATFLHEFLTDELNIAHPLELCFQMMGTYFDWNVQDVQMIKHMNISFMESPIAGNWRLVYFGKNQKWAVVEIGEFDALATAVNLPLSHRDKAQRDLALSLGTENLQWTSMPQPTVHEITRIAGMALKSQSNIPEQPNERGPKERLRIAALRLTARLVNIRDIVQRHDCPPLNTLFTIGTDPVLVGSVEGVTYETLTQADQILRMHQEGAKRQGSQMVISGC